MRDRIKELRRIKAGTLKPHPLNWRTHPEGQRGALLAILQEVGYAAALLARELPDGTLELIDGHLRAETTPDAEVPVLIVDLDEAEAAKLLATLDPLAAMAGANQELLSELLSGVESQSEALQSLFESLSGKQQGLEELSLERPEPALPEAFQVVVDCQDESQQQEVYERMTAEGFSCRLLLL